MRVAIFSEVYWPMVSGVALTLRRLSDGLQARGHEVRVYSGSYPLPPGADDRPDVHRSPSSPLFVAPEVHWCRPRLGDVVADLRRFRPDVVHLATEFPMGVAGLRAAQELRLPVIASAHTDYERYAASYGLQWAVLPGWHYLRWFYRHAHKVLAPTRVFEQFLQSRGVTHTGIWTRGINPDEFHPRFRSEAWRARFGLAPGDPLVLYAGRLAPEKNLPLLLDAWAALGPRRGRAQLVLVGDGMMAAGLRERGLPGVHLTGYLHGRELATAYASADLFAFPSTTETFGNVLLEAMGSGVASIAAAAGGVLDFAQDGENALLVAPDDAASLGAALERLVADRPLRARLAEGGRRVAAARSWDAIYARLLDDYAEAVAGRRKLLRAA